MALGLCVPSLRRSGPGRTLGRVETSWIKSRVDAPPCSTAAGNRVARTNPRNATRCPARCRSPRSSRSCASGNTAPAEATARPSAARNTACTPLQRTRRTRLPEAGPASDLRTRVPASAASPPTSPSDRPEPPPIAPSPSLIPAMPRRQYRISRTRLRQRAVKRAAELRRVAGTGGGRASWLRDRDRPEVSPIWSAPSSTPASQAGRRPRPSSC